MTEKLKFEAPRKAMALLVALTITLGPTTLPAFAAAKPASATPNTATPIKHLVVIFNENVSFDHYFGTYPVATNPGGEPRFVAAPNTPTVNGLTGGLLTLNPNLNTANGTGAANPFRLDRSQAVTNDQDHDYTAEQQAFDAGADGSVPDVYGHGRSAAVRLRSYARPMAWSWDISTAIPSPALWNYAQHFAMSDNSYSTTFGPSTPGAAQSGFRPDQRRHRHVERDWRRSERRQRRLADHDRRRRSDRRRLLPSDPRAGHAWAARTSAIS